MTDMPDIPPPAAARPELPPVCVEEAWRHARDDYEAGVSIPVAADRHGLAERSLRRRAQVEGWRRPGLPPMERRYAMLAGEPRSVDEVIEDNPMMGPFVEAHSWEVGELLMRPEPERLQRFAFRRAAECAASGAAVEAAGWLRLVTQVARVRRQLEEAAHGYNPADLMRAHYAAGLFADLDDDEDDVADEGEGDAAAPAPCALRRVGRFWPIGHFFR